MLNNSVNTSSGSKGVEIKSAFISIDKLREYKKTDQVLNRNLIYVNDFTLTSQIIYDFFIFLGIFISLFLIALGTLYVLNLTTVIERIPSPLTALTNLAVSAVYGSGADATAPIQSQCILYQINTCQGGEIDARLLYVRTTQQ